MKMKMDTADDCYGVENMNTVDCQDCCMDDRVESMNTIEILVVLCLGES
jgi:hypothetical protein